MASTQRSENPILRLSATVDCLCLLPQLNQTANSVLCSAFAWYPTHARYRWGGLRMAVSAFEGPSLFLFISKPKAHHSASASKSHRLLRSLRQPILCLASTKTFTAFSISLDACLIFICSQFVSGNARIPSIPKVENRSLTNRSEEHTSE